MRIVSTSVFLLVLFQARESFGFILGNNDTQGTCADATPNCDLFDICQDNLVKAKELCRKHCNLCDVVDGYWSLWGSWGQCDVTCGNGTMSRVRICDNPAPAHGGDDCQGDNNQTTTCVMNKCPVNGGWSGWSLWGSCSSTCGIGMQRRDRTCDNPLPSKDGNHCFGDSGDNRMCTDIQCPVGWTTWSDYSTCSVTCGTGLRQRSRSCQNPLASLMNNRCSGNAEETEMCTSSSCTGLSAFTATGYAPYGADSIRFPYVILNEGNDYNSTTGVFTCRVPGLYLVTVTIGKRAGVVVDYIECYLDINGNSEIDMFHNPSVDDDAYTFSATGTFRLHIHDRVNVGECTNRDKIFDSVGTLFSAVLISPDQL